MYLRQLVSSIRFGVTPTLHRGFTRGSLSYSTKKFTKSHEWVEKNGKIVTIGVTKYATQHLGEVVFAELPESGSPATQGESLAAIESVKAVGEIYSPVTGVVVEANPELTDNFSLINEDPEAQGWICKVEVSEDLDSELMDKKSYDAFLETQAE